MRDKEFPPLLLSGFQAIAEDDFEGVFVKPFGFQNATRTKLAQDFVLFLKEFKKLNVYAEIWINGSFATEAPNPNDVDVVFFFEPAELDRLDAEQQERFLRLFDKSNKKFIRNVYGVEVFASIIGNQQEEASWLQTFGTMYDNITPKGIFKLIYTPI